MLGLGLLGTGLKAIGGVLKGRTEVAVARISSAWGAIGQVGAAGITSFIKALGGMCLIAMLIGVLLYVFFKEELGLFGSILVPSFFTLIGFVVLYLRFKLRLLTLKSKIKK